MLERVMTFALECGLRAADLCLVWAQQQRLPPVMHVMVGVFAPGYGLGVEARGEADRLLGCAGVRRPAELRGVAFRVAGTRSCLGVAPTSASLRPRGLRLAMVVENSADCGLLTYCGLIASIFMYMR